MNKEELIGKLQMVYVGEKNAIDDLVVYYDGLQEIIKIVRKENKILKERIDNQEFLLKSQGKELKELYTENEQLENQLDFISEQNKYINKLEKIITKAKELKHKWQKKKVILL